LTNEINVKQSAHPGFADLDNDGRLDLIVGEADGNFNYFKNLFANPLPVELTTFIANLSGKSITLNWTTSTETNNLGFEIQRKTFKDSQWQTIGFKDGNGTTVETKSYSYVDNINELSSEKIFYRLKQVDFNGNFKFSNEIEVNIAPAKFSLEQNYPNPFNPTTKIKYSISTSPQTPLLAKERDKGEVVTLKIYDILGNEITSLVNREQQPGNYEIEFDGSKLGSGVYVYTLKAGNYISSKKMTLMK
ncbi:MAG: T9SS type A sorting domain-containing protein, partial [Ignavibacteriaceae bacterium]